MKNIEEIADGIYAYCVYAMDYDMMGLVFDESSLLSAIKNKKSELQELSEEEYVTLNETLKTKVSSLYERNKAIVEQEVVEGDVVKNMERDDALAEMTEAEDFMNYLSDELDYDYVKKIVE